MTDVLWPLEQLHALNKEAYEKLDEIEKPLIVVGGQAIAYWINYYDLKNAQNEKAAYSVDIDYVAKLNDIKLLNQVWKSFLQVAVNNPPPSLASILLQDGQSNKIKEVDGALFVDIDKYKQKQIKPNLVDVIDRPQGFDYNDINTENGLMLHTVPFVFPESFHLIPHDKLRILTPIACLKSRLANHKEPPVKPPSIERTRIRCLISPIIYYIQDQLDEVGFRNTKKQINLLIDLIASTESIHLSVNHNIHLLEILDFFVEQKIEGLPDIFVQRELTQKIKEIQTKISKKEKSLKK